MRKVLLPLAILAVGVPTGVVIWRKVVNRPVPLSIAELYKDPLKWAGRMVVVEGRVESVSAFYRWVWYTLRELEGEKRIKVLAEMAPEKGQVLRVKAKVRVPLTIRSRPVSVPILGKVFLEEKERWELVERRGGGWFFGGKGGQAR